MAHSTGTTTRLNRKGFYNGADQSAYGREELVAELTAALTLLYMGVSSTIREENVAYIKGWLIAIKQEPKFLFSVLADARKAVKFISDKMGISPLIEIEAEAMQS